MKSILLVLIGLLLIACDGPVTSGNRVCSVMSKIGLDVSPEPRELQIEIKQCNTESYELEVSLESKTEGRGLVLIRQDLGNLTDEPTISGLEIKLSKTEFREYTLHMPAYVDFDKCMSLRTIHAKKCLELKDIDLCFEQQS